MPSYACLKSSSFGVPCVEITLYLFFVFPVQALLGHFVFCSKCKRMCGVFYKGILHSDHFRTSIFAGIGRGDHWPGEGKPHAIPVIMKGGTLMAIFQRLPGHWLHPSSVLVLSRRHRSASLCVPKSTFMLNAFSGKERHPCHCAHITVKAMCPLSLL